MIVDEEIAKEVLSHISRDRAIASASKLISIPSWDRKGQEEVAKYCAAYMEEIGMEIQLQDVTIEEGVTTKQTFGRIPGTGGAPSLMLCSHLDTVTPYGFDSWTKQLGQVEGDWVYGVGGQKCGMAAMLESARAIKETLKLKGDLILACVAEEMTGGIGIQNLLEYGIKPDMAIVGEDSDLQIVTTSVAGIFGSIHIKGRPDKPKGTGGVNPLDKMYKLLQELRPFQLATPGGWLAYKPRLDLPGYPRFNIVSIELEPPQYPTDCTILFDIRIVPGQSEETVKRDLVTLLMEMKSRDPDLVAELTMPAPGWFNRQPFEISPSERIVETVARWHQYITGTKPYIGAGCRSGFASDANNLMAAGIRCVNYGPGDFGNPIDERKKIEDIVKAAKVYALAATEICG